MPSSDPPFSAASGSSSSSWPFSSGSIALLVAAGITRRQTWGRIGGFVLGALMLPLFPVGTILGLFVLTGLAGADAKSWFGSAG